MRNKSSIIWIIGIIFEIINKSSIINITFIQELNKTDLIIEIFFLITVLNITLSLGRRNLKLQLLNILSILMRGMGIIRISIF